MHSVVLKIAGNEISEPFQQVRRIVNTFFEIIIYSQPDSRIVVLVISPEYDNGSCWFQMKFWDQMKSANDHKDCRLQWKTKPLKL